jgi:hypothetical protein
MKKMFSLISALFLGGAAFAQVTKTDSTNNTVTRKVLDSDVKDLPVDAAAKSGHIKGGATQKGRDGKVVATEKQHYIVKLSNASSKAAADSAAQQKTKATTQSDIFIKTPSPKK